MLNRLFFRLPNKEYVGWYSVCQRPDATTEAPKKSTESSEESTSAEKSEVEAETEAVPAETTPAPPLRGLDALIARRRAAGIGGRPARPVRGARTP
ncbi:jg24263 [Pararge aegeria aegeria]|uniref:Jg24263 protein n=1 Tax=Pararge aegeria aegeria TaxID=348720 RepID=A0A8S4QQX7_9NEOP|nr:jg24263 [Pararge aegeria aegeria]